MDTIETKTIGKIAELQLTINDMSKTISDLESTIRNITAENARLVERLRDAERVSGD